MIKKIAPVMMILFLIILSPCHGNVKVNFFQDGFQNIPWGTQKADLPDLGLSKKSIKGIYSSGESSVLFMEGKGNLEMKFGSVPLLSIFLRFSDTVFYAVDMVFQEEDYQKIYDELIQKSGKPNLKTETDLKWMSDSITITLTNREILIVSSVK